MFQAFQRAFVPDPQVPSRGSPDQLSGILANAAGAGLFLKMFQGSSFNSGLYRVHRIDDIPSWTAVVGRGFPDFQQRIQCFAYDWLGRQFALDAGRMKRGEPQILLLEPGTGEALEAPFSFRDFHDRFLAESTDDALAGAFFRAWHEHHPAPLAFDQCVGYKIPLFLGGDDDLDNLELTSLEMYWELTVQLLEQTRDLPPGTPIADIKLR